MRLSPHHGVSESFAGVCLASGEVGGEPTPDEKRSQGKTGYRKPSKGNEQPFIAPKPSNEI
jgi:hypothetical protein